MRRLFIVVTLSALTLGCLGGKKKDERKGRKAREATPQQPVSQPEQGKVSPHREPVCFTHAKDNIAMRVEIAVERSKIDGGWIQFDRQGERIKAPIVDGTAEKDGMSLKVESPKGKTMDLNVTINLDGKFLDFQGKRLPGDLQNIACSDLQ